MKKVLIIRFSSIGDIVLTTPIIRCLKNQVEGIEIHYLTKDQFEPLLRKNPYIDTIHTIKKKISEVLPRLKNEDFDHIIDLHKNFRSLGVRLSLKKPATGFPKINFQKWLIVKFKLDRLPRVHIVDRYFRALDKFYVKNDGKGLDYFIPEVDMVNKTKLPETHHDEYIGFAIGGKHNTKIFPQEKVIEICKIINKPIVLLGGEEDRQRGEHIRKACGDLIFNACGNMNINQSASLIDQAKIIITNDTGLMHIAAALKKHVISIWGNTIPEFGMYPYFPKSENSKSTIIQVQGLKCRPCSKLGYEKCPKGHFECMMGIDAGEVVNAVQNII
jgi:ADP-heptose:LPS heptosyltransferase